MNKTNLFVTGGILIIIIAGTAQFLYPRSAVSPTTSTATSTIEQIEQNVSTTTIPVVSITNVTVTTQKEPVAYSLSLEKDDNIVSWNFQGAYTGNPELVVKAQSEIQRLSEQLKTATSSAMILSVGIANQYELLGDGKKQYEYLERAIRTNPENGLPWHNVGVLMERLGAYKTAQVAYEKSTLVEQQTFRYHYSYLEFLIQKMKEDSINIEKAFAAAKSIFGNKPDLIELRAEWEKS